MSDIVERLRAVAAMDLGTGGFLAHTLDTAKEAADEIERLRRDHVGAHRVSGDTIGMLEAEIERLRTERAAAVDAFELLAAEHDRLRAAKRRALQMADLRSKENVELREKLWSVREDLAHIVQQIDNAISPPSSREYSSPESLSAAPVPPSE